MITTAMNTTVPPMIKGAGSRWPRRSIRSNGPTGRGKSRRGGLSPGGGSRGGNRRILTRLNIPGGPGVTHAGQIRGLYHSPPSQHSDATLTLYKSGSLPYNIARKRREHLLD